MLCAPLARGGPADATRFARSDVDWGNAMVAHAHAAPVQRLALLLVAVVAGACGWRVRVVAHR
ncbi:hypothetical protein [Cellulomonas sp. Y8]|uniref:hypothetical protein n=1 Tax=Cellulomonas sp. Y8 TaxID=2591145 RepID=UPI003D748715